MQAFPFTNSDPQSLLLINLNQPPTLQNPVLLSNLTTHIGDLEAENSKVNIASASHFNVDHFEREGAT